MHSDGSQKHILEITENVHLGQLWLKPHCQVV